MTRPIIPFYWYLSLVQMNRFDFIHHERLKFLPFCLWSAFKFILPKKCQTQNGIGLHLPVSIISKILVSTFVHKNEFQVINFVKTKFRVINFIKTKFLCNFRFKIASGVCVCVIRVKVKIEFNRQKQSKIKIQNVNSLNTV